jgi:uncharacterized protein (TIGR03435 family)
MPQPTQHLAYGRYTGTNMSIIDMLASICFPLPRSHIVGGPNWIRTERFNIVAKADGTPSRDQIFAMLRSLLEDRFQLVVHTEQRQGEIYDLILARSDGQLGPNLRRSTPDCTPRGTAPTADGAPQPPPCPAANYPGHITGKAMAMLTPMLATWLDQREVRDRTGLSGRFDVDLIFTPDRPSRLPPNAPDDLTRAVQAIDPNGPSLLTALREQLG